MTASRSAKALLRKLEVSHDENLTYKELFLSVRTAHLICTMQYN